MKVLQFGEGNFLRGFFNWGVQNLVNEGSDVEITVVSPIDSDFIIDLLKKQNFRYTVVLEGLKNGNPVQKKDEISVIKNAYNAYKDWNSVKEFAKDPELKLIISNTTEAGIAYDESCQFEDAPAASFPAKMTQLLYTRFEQGLPGLTILPCELIEKNGATLKEYILRYLQKWSLCADFAAWIEDECIFYNTLVDRIVPGFPKEQANKIQEEIGWDDNLIVKAEPFGFWGIERVFKNDDEKGRASAEDLEALDKIIALSKSGIDVVYTNNLQPYRERKVHLLNAPHTAMSMIGIPQNVETVEEMVTIEPNASKIRELMFNEIIPKLNLPEKELIDFANQVVDRFKNPFNRHELSSIALNEESKYEVRVLPITQRYLDAGEEVPPVLSELQKIAKDRWGKN